jgi:hypothetical protein
MKNKINKICTELNDGKIAVVQATEQLFDLYSVSQQRELLIAFDTMREFDIKHDDIEESVDYFLKNKESYL